MIFLVVVIGILALIHGYVGIRLIPSLALSRRWLTAAWTIIAILTILPLLPIFLRFAGYENRLHDLLSWVAYSSLGFFFLTFVVVLARDMGWVIWIAGSKVFMWTREMISAGSSLPAPFDPGRRQFIINAMNLGLVGMTGGLSVYGLVLARRKAKIFTEQVPIKALPPQFEGLRIVQISDLHVGPTIKKDWVRRVVEQVMDLNPDLIAFTGDLVDGSVDYLSDDVSPLVDLVAPLGKFFVTGNHEYYSGVDHWLPVIEGLGFVCLMNEHQVIERDGAQLTIAGVTDLTAYQIVPDQASNPEAALAGAPAETPKILLAHQPGSIFDAQRLGVDLQLSGHTHGGQIIPFNYVAAKAHPYIAGMHNHNGTWIYVNRGTGYWGPPMRLGVPPEITLLELTAA